MTSLATASSAALRGLLVVGLSASLAPAALASSHREAPFIAKMPKVDATDFYMFRSYEPGRAGFVTLIANYQPLQDPYGGPNYFTLDQNALYEIHIDNNGDAKEDLTFQFRFRNTSKDIALNVGGKSVPIPLFQAGQITSVNPGTLNVRETFTVDVVRGDRRGGARARVVNAAGGGAEFDKPADYIGTKTFPDYAAYANQHQYAINVPGCGTPGRVFVGQRKDPFKIAVGEIFDLINLTPGGPLGPESGNADDLADKNVTSMVLELPIACLTAGNETVIGAWTTASVRQGRLLRGQANPGLDEAAVVGGPWVQVSRLSNPLVNEVVIGLRDKNKFNSSKPVNDAANFADYVTNPTLPALIQTLFPSATAPTKFPRTDLLAAFLTGLSPKAGNLNKPANVVPAEMLRLNTAVPPTAAATQSRLGVAAGDNAGFPNGRRPGDDVVDIALRVVMGALCQLTGPTDALNVGCAPGDAPAGGLAFTDGVLTQASQYPTAFPYLLTPLPGSPTPVSAP